MDASFKLLATEGEYALTLSAMLPSALYEDTFSAIPLLYIMTHDKAAISSGTDYAFLYGQLMTFDQLQAYQVYEDERYVCYEISGLIYSDPQEYVSRLAGWNSAIRYDSQGQAMVQNMLDYYKENLGDLFYYK